MIRTLQYHFGSKSRARFTHKVAILLSNEPLTSFHPCLCCWKISQPIKLSNFLGCEICGDQLLVKCFDITNIYINSFDKDVIYRSAHVTKLYITNLYKQDAVSVTRQQCTCGISDFELSIIAYKYISCNVKLNVYTFRALKHLEALIF